MADEMGMNEPNDVFALYPEVRTFYIYAAAGQA